MSRRDDSEPMLAHADMRTDTRAARSAGAARSGSASLTRAVKPVDELIRFVVAPDGAVVPDLKRRLPGRGVWVTATPRGGRRGGQAQGFRPRLQARGARRARSRPRGRAAAGARRARCAGDRPQGRPGRDRLRQDRGRARRRAGGGGPAAPPMASADGVAQDRGRRGAAPNRRKRRRNPDHRGVYDGAIGFGIGAVKCGTCCPARRPSEQRVPCALPEPRTLPDRSIRADVARDSARLRLTSNVRRFRIGCEWLLIRKNPGEKLSVTSTKTLTLKPRAETGVVRQSFTHGRSKAVVVEKVKRRVGRARRRRGAAPAPAPIAARRRAAAASSRAAATPVGRADTGRHRRAAAEAVRRRAAHADRGRAEPRARTRSATPRCARPRSARSPRKRRRSAPSATRSSAPSARPPKRASARGRSPPPRRRDQAQGRRGRQEALRRRGRSDAKPASAPIARKLTPEAEDDDRRPVRRGAGGAAGASRRRRPKAPRAGAPKQRGRLTLVTALTADEVRERSVASFRRRTQRMTGHRDSEHEGKARARSDRSRRRSPSRNSPTACRSARVDVIKLLMKQGQMAKITDMIDADTAQLIAEELGHTVRRVAESDVEEGLFDAADDAGDAACRVRRSSPSWATSTTARPRCSTPSATTNVVGGEAGGITQHIGAYQVTSPNGRQDHLHRHARPRRLHRDARARRQGDRHRRAGGRGRRRRHAADGRGDQSRQGGQGADDRRDQQDRQAGRQARARAHRAAAARGAGRIAGRRRARRRGLGDQEAPISTSCSRRSRCRPKCSTSRPIRTAPPKAP